MSRHSKNMNGKPKNLHILFVLERKSSTTKIRKNKDECSKGHYISCIRSQISSLDLRVEESKHTRNSIPLSQTKIVKHNINTPSEFHHCCTQEPPDIEEVVLLEELRECESKIETELKNMLQVIKTKDFQIKTLTKKLEKYETNYFFRILKHVVIEAERKKSDNRNSALAIKTILLKYGKDKNIF
ncbi:Protein of unknown function [Gryllus bimaculatus]|nr:Protein of unknown function [Gryllus bimaculatus]